MTGKLMRQQILVSATILMVLMLLLGVYAPASAAAPTSGLIQMAAQTKTGSTATLPKLVTITTGETTTAVYQGCVGLRAAVEKFSPMRIRVEPYDTDLSRMMPLKIGETQFAHQTGLVAYWVTRGLQTFQDWGPTPLRRVWKGKPFVGAMWARGDAGFKTIADLKGKRIPQSPAARPWNLNTEACLLFGGLTLQDVKVVTVSGVLAGNKGPLEGVVDATHGTPWGGPAQELAASRHGIKWFDMPASDKAGWARLQKLTPWAVPIPNTAAGLKTGEKITTSGYEYGVYAYPNVPDEVVYAIVKALKDGYDLMAPMHPDLVDWTWDRAKSTEGALDIPFHEGTVKFFKDNGVWTPELDAFQQAQVKAEKERTAKKK